MIQCLQSNSPLHLDQFNSKTASSKEEAEVECKWVEVAEEVCREAWVEEEAWAEVA